MVGGSGESKFILADQSIGVRRSGDANGMMNTPNGEQVKFHTVNKRTQTKLLILIKIHIDEWRMEPGINHRTRLIAE